MARPNGRRGCLARKRESRRSNSRASTFKLRVPSKARLYDVLLATDASFTFFYSFLLTRSLGLNSVQLRKWHSDLRHGQREFLPVKKPNGGIVTDWMSWVTTGR